MHTYIHLLYIPIYYIIVHIIQHCIHRHMHTHIPCHWILCLYGRLQIWPYTRTVRGQKYLVKYGLFASWITPTRMKKTSDKPGLVLLSNKVITVEIRVCTLLLPTKFFLKPAKATPILLVLSYWDLELLQGKKGSAKIGTPRQMYLLLLKENSVNCS